MIQCAGLGYRNEVRESFSRGSPSDYRFEALWSDRQGPHGIRITEQSRILSIHDAIYTDLSGCCLTAQATEDSCKTLPRNLQARDCICTCGSLDTDKALVSEETKSEWRWPSHGCSTNRDIHAFWDRDLRLAKNGAKPQP